MTVTGDECGRVGKNPFVKKVAIFVRGTIQLMDPTKWLNALGVVDRRRVIVSGPRLNTGGDFYTAGVVLTTRCITQTVYVVKI